MGLILNNNVEESKIYSAYGLTVYGKVNRYVWTIDNNREENALTTIRVEDTNGNDIFSMYMGNRCIFQCRIDDTMDNFLYWIAKDQPDEYRIENQVFKSLCQADSLFNHSIFNRKQKEKRQAEEAQRIAERQTTEEKQIAMINDYCIRKGLFFCQDYTEGYILKALTEAAFSMLNTADKKQIDRIIQLATEHPENKDVRIVKHDTIENIVKDIKQEGWLISMKRKTYNNVLKAARLIMKKGYEEKESLEMAVKIFDEMEMLQNGMSAEWFIEKIASKN